MVTSTGDLKTYDSRKVAYSLNPEKHKKVCKDIKIYIKGQKKEQNERTALEIDVFFSPEPEDDKTPLQADTSNPQFHAGRNLETLAELYFTEDNKKLIFQMYEVKDVLIDPADLVKIIKDNGGKLYHGVALKNSQN